MDSNRSHSVAPPRMTMESAAQFQQGINLLLSRWTALQMAIQHEWGGTNSREKAHQLAVDIFSLFTQSKEQVFMDDVEDLLNKSMDSLSVMIEDGSIEETALDLMYMNEGCLEGNFSSIEKLKEKAPRSGLASCVRQGESDDEISGDDESSEMDVDASEPQTNLNRRDMMVDEPTHKEPTQTDDGWTVVSSKRNKGRKGRKN